MFIVAEGGAARVTLSLHTTTCCGCQAARVRHLAMELHTRERGRGILGQLEIELAASRDFGPVPGVLGEPSLINIVRQSTKTLPRMAS